jgi:hypothetical protein
MGMFDDLVPQGASVPQRGGAFDDLIPTMEQATQMSELDRRMSDRVAKEAKSGIEPQPSIAQYLPFGSWLDEAAAGLDTGLGKLTGGKFGAASYDEAKAYQNARQRYIDENASGLRKGAAMVGGMVASAPFGAANVFRGATLLPQMGNAAITGAGYGALYGSGQGEGSERLGNAAGGAAMGAALGSAIVPVARGIGNAAGYIRDRALPQTGPLAGMERRAVNSTIDDMQSSGLDAQQYANRRADLGERGMLLDMGEDLTLTGEALANTNGPQMQGVRGALRDRSDSAAGVIASTLNNNLGMPANVVQLEQQIRQHYNTIARPLYEQFHATSIPVTQPIAQVLGDIPASAYNAAQRLATAEGHRQQFRLRPVNDPMTAMTGVRGSRREQVPTGLEYDYLKRAVDDMARSAERGSNEHRVYSDLARRLRNTIDETLSPGAPDQSSWAQARAVAGDGIGAREAMEEGGRAFSKGVTPDQMQATRQGYSQLENAAYNIGARDQLHTTMGNAATNFRQNGDATVRRQLNSQFAQDKLQQIATPQQAANITRRVNAENRFAETANQVMGNSATARRTAAQRRLPMSSEKPLGDNHPRTIGEAAFVGARKVLNAVMAGGLNERAGRIMADQARILTARGVERDQLVQALLMMGQRRGVNAQHRQQIITLINQLGAGARAPLIESATSQRANP